MHSHIPRPGWNQTMIIVYLISYYPIILIASKWRGRTWLRRLRIQSRDSHWKYIWESNVAPALIVVWRTKLSVFLSRNPQTLVISISQQRLLFVIISQFGLSAGQASLNFAKCSQIFPKCFDRNYMWFSTNSQQAPRCFSNDIHVLSPKVLRWVPSHPRQVLKLSVWTVKHCFPGGLVVAPQRSQSCQSLGKIKGSVVESLC